MKRMMAFALVSLLALPALPAQATVADYATCARAVEGPFNSDLLNACTSYLDTALERYHQLLREQADAQYQQAYDRHLDLVLQLTQWFARHHESAPRQ